MGVIDRNLGPQLIGPGDRWELVVGCQNPPGNVWSYHLVMPAPLTRAQLLSGLSAAAGGAATFSAWLAGFEGGIPWLGDACRATGLTQERVAAAFAERRAALGG